MKSRREFLHKTTLTLLLVPLGASACSGSVGFSPTVSASTSCTDGVDRTSTVVNGHTHTVCIGAADLAVPPAEGMTFATSETQGHSHMMSLTQEQLQTIARGREVTVQTSTVQLHHHEIVVVTLASPEGVDIGDLGVDGGGTGGGGTNAGQPGL